MYLLFFFYLSVLARVFSSNQRSLILRTGVEFGDRSYWDFAFDRYKTTGDTAYLVAMANSKDPVVINM